MLQTYCATILVYFDDYWYETVFFLYIKWSDHWQNWFSSMSQFFICLNLLLLVIISKTILHAPTSLLLTSNFKLRFFLHTGSLYTEAIINFWKSLKNNENSSLKNADTKAIFTVLISKSHRWDQQHLNESNMSDVINDRSSSQWN